MRIRYLMLCLVAVPGATAAQFVGHVNSGSPRLPGAMDADTRGPRVPMGNDVGDIRQRIRDGRDSGQLTRSEARRLRRETGQLGVLADRYGIGGLSDAEARELDARASVLRDQVNTKRLQGTKR